MLSLGLWHNFGGVDNFPNARSLVLRASDLGITHFDIANNYGPPPGSARPRPMFRFIFRQELSGHRDELIVSTTAGYDMWDGPYGNWGSRKYLLSSLDQSLKCLGLRLRRHLLQPWPDPETPIEETMGAPLPTPSGFGQGAPRRHRLRRGPDRARVEDPAGDGYAPGFIHQPGGHQFDRGPERGLLDALSARESEASRSALSRRGCSPAATWNGIPSDSRASHDPWPRFPRTSRPRSSA